MTGPGVPGEVARTASWASRHSTSRSQQRGPRRGRQASNPCPEIRRQRPTSPDGAGSGAAAASSAVSGLAETRRRGCRRDRCRRRSRLGAAVVGGFDSVWRGSRRRPGTGALHGRVGKGPASLLLGRASGVRESGRAQRNERVWWPSVPCRVVLAVLHSKSSRLGGRIVGIRRVAAAPSHGFGPPLALNGRPLFESERELAGSGSGSDGAVQGRRLMAGGGAGHGSKTPGSDKMLQCEPLLVILGIRSVAQHVAVPVRWEKLSGRCRLVPSPLSLPAAWNGTRGQR